MYAALPLSEVLDERKNSLQVDHLKEWTDQHLRDVGEGLWALDVDMLELTDDERAGLYQEIAASRFEEKYTINWRPCAGQ